MNAMDRALLFPNTLAYRLRKIACFTGLDVYVRRGEEGDDNWLMVCADEETEFGIRPAATASGCSDVAVVDALLVKLGLCEAEDGSIRRARPAPMTAAEVAGAMNLAEAPGKSIPVYQNGVLEQA